MTLTIAVLISGNGTNLQAIIDAIQNGAPLKILTVISNNEKALGLKRAEKADIPTHVIKEELELQSCIDQYQPQFIVLAGFMKILSPAFIRHYPQKIINIHPSLLPKYPGLHTHQQVIDHHDKEHGCTVHFVTEIVDGGPIIAQSKLTVDPNDTAETLRQRVQQLEHTLYPRVLVSLIKTVQ